MKKRLDVWKVAAPFLDMYGMAVHNIILKGPKHEPYWI